MKGVTNLNDFINSKLRRHGRIGDENCAANVTELTPIDELFASQNSYFFAKELRILFVRSITE